MIVSSSDVCEMVCDALVAWLNGGPSAWLCLFSNGIPLTPDSENPASYVETSYPAYARFGTVGLWAPTQRADAGIYFTQSGPYTFPANNALVPVYVFGWFLLRGTRVVLMETFPGGPVIIDPGAPGVTVLLRPQFGAQSVVCPSS